MEEEEKTVKKQEKKVKKEFIYLGMIIFAIVVIDQIIKIVISQIGEVNLIPNILTLKISENTSAAYGIGSGSTIMYVLTNIVILGVIFKFMTAQNEFIDTKLKVFLSFILAGGISNVIDRVFRGYVVEFLDFRQLAPLPVFNLADLFVLIGWVCVAAIFASFTVKEWRSKKTKKEILKEEEKKK